MSRQLLQYFEMYPVRPICIYKMEKCHCYCVLYESITKLSSRAKAEILSNPHTLDAVPNLKFLKLCFIITIPRSKLWLSRHSINLLKSLTLCSSVYQVAPQSVGPQSTFRGLQSVHVVKNPHRPQLTYKQFVNKIISR